jgi:glycosyltransferase involved in cell wall biosynthesis
MEALPLEVRSLPVTVLVAARNESANIARCIESLKPAARVVVLDSGSTDGTSSIAAAAGAEVVQFAYRGGYPKKRQWAIDNLAFDTEWILLVDADEQIPIALWHEIFAAIRQEDGPSAYFIRKGFHFLGRRFRSGGFSFDAILLFRIGSARFEYLVEDDPSGMDMEIHERLIVDGKTARLGTPLIHDDFKGLDSYIDKHNRYSDWEAHVRSTFLRTGRWGVEAVKPRLFGNPQEIRRFLKLVALRIPLEPTLWFLYHYLFRGGFLEGARGYIACRIRSAYIAAVRAKMYELRLRK